MMNYVHHGQGFRGVQVREAEEITEIHHKDRGEGATASDKEAERTAGGIFRSPPSMTTATTMGG